MDSPTVSLEGASENVCQHGGQEGAGAIYGEHEEPSDDVQSTLRASGPSGSWTPRSPGGRRMSMTIPLQFRFQNIGGQNDTSDAAPEVRSLDWFPI